MTSPPAEPDRPDRPDASAEPDALLVERVLAGEREAFDRLARRYERQALAVAYRLLNQAQDAQEVVQEALLKAYRALATLDNREIFGPWFLRIVSNLSLNYRRSRARRPAVSLEDAGPSDEGHALAQTIDSGQQRPDQELATGELSDRIQRALDELPERQRMALVLFSIEQMPQKEVAEVIGCSVEAVKWHVFTARKKLKEKLSDLIGEP